MTTSEILLAAADHLERHGWQQWLSGSAGQPCCLVGAIKVACRGVEADYIAARNRLYEHLGTSSGVPLLVDWNDTFGRTADEVIAALRAAAGAKP